jgi:hypothetical protein
MGALRSDELRAGDPVEYDLDGKVTIRTVKAIHHEGMTVRIVWRSGEQTITHQTRLWILPTGQVVSHG